LWLLRQSSSAALMSASSAVCTGWSTGSTLKRKVATFRYHGQERRPVQQQRPASGRELLVLAVHPVDGPAEHDLILGGLQPLRGVVDGLVGQAEDVALDERAVLDGLPRHRATAVCSSVPLTAPSTARVYCAQPFRTAFAGSALPTFVATAAGRARLVPELVGEALAVREVTRRAGQVEVPAGDAHLQLVARAGLDGLFSFLTTLWKRIRSNGPGAGDSGPDARFDALAGEPLRGERQDRLRERAAGVAHHLRHDLPPPDGRVRLT
jgi:hypothetical protein